MTEVVEYGIEWLAPADIAGSVTPIGKGDFGLQMAHHRVQLAYVLPGQMRGKVVERTITTTDWGDL